MHPRTPIRTALAAMTAGLLLVITSPVAVQAATTTPPDDFAVEAPAFAQLRGISLAEAEQRLGWQQIAPTLATNLAADIPTRFGGLWIDVNNGDRVKIGITGRIDSTIAATVTREATAVGLTSGYDMVSVTRTEATLQSDMTWLASQLATVNSGAAATLAAGERTDLNQLALHLPSTGTLTAAQTAMVSAAQARLGSELLTVGGASAFHQLSCVYPFCDAPLRAGVRISVPNLESCTLGFIAQSRVDSKEYGVTAGHCGLVAGGATWHTQFTNGSDQPIGATWHFIFSTSLGDEAIVSINNVAGLAPQGRVQVTASPWTTADPNYFIKADNWSVLGQRICTTGSFGGMSTCGFVSELNYSYVADGFEFDHAGLSTICSVHGDSGAPMYALHIAYGILDAGDDQCDTAYYGIRNAETQLNVNLIFATS
jgi:hypothetical protein